MEALERYYRFVEGENQFGTEFDFSQNLMSAVDNLSLVVKCSLGQFSSLKDCVRRKRPTKFNDSASIVLFDLCHSVYSSPERIVKLLRLGADPNFMNSNRTCLHNLVEVSSASSLQALLMSSDEPVEQVIDENGNTPLILACRKKQSTVQLKIVKHLLSGRCALNIVNSEGKSAIAYALAHSNVPLVQQLLMAGAGVVTLTTEFLLDLLSPSPIETVPATDAQEEALLEVDEEEEKHEPEQYLEEFLDGSAVSSVPPRKTSTAVAPVEVSIVSERRDITTRQPSILVSMDLARSLQTSKSNGSSIDELQKQHCLDYNQSTSKLLIHRIRYSMSAAEVCQRMVNFRLIEEERQMKKTIASYENKTLSLLMSRRHWAVTEGPVMTAAERKSQRRKRKLTKLSRRVPLETVKERRELELWDAVRARILNRIDQEYNTTASMKGLYK